MVLTAALAGFQNKEHRTTMAWLSGAWADKSEAKNAIKAKKADVAAKIKALQEKIKQPFLMQNNLSCLSNFAYNNFSLMTQI